MGCGPGKKVSAESNLLDTFFGKLNKITSRADGFMILPGDLLPIQTNTNIEFIVKINQHLRLRHAGVVPTGLNPFFSNGVLPIAPIDSISPEGEAKKIS